MHLNADMEAYIRRSLPELRSLIRDLCAIPAPSHHEEKRASFCRKWFADHGCDVFVDDVLNVICPWNMTDDNDLIVFMAHTDTVFPDLEPMPFAEEGDRMFCPGVTDDTASLAVMMICARYVIQNKLPVKTGMLFVANSCEEGLGNLKGSLRIIEAYGKRIRALVTLDGTRLNAVVNRAVGSRRYRVTATTQGGHSFSHFGNKNAIHCLAEIISDLYRVDIPIEEGSKTTYNVGLISGGTSVNTIAQRAEMLYEYRSDNLKCMCIMQEKFEAILEKHISGDVQIAVEKIGDRPCAGNVNPDAQAALLQEISDALRTTLGVEADFRSGSTDANAALAEGIPAACISVCRGGSCHTREEWLDTSSLEDGCRLLMNLLCRYIYTN